MNKATKHDRATKHKQITLIAFVLMKNVQGIPIHHISLTYNHHVQLKHQKKSWGVNTTSSDAICFKSLSE